LVAYLLMLAGLENECIIMVYLVCVLVTTVRTESFIFGIIDSLLSLVVFSYVFTEPKMTFQVYSKRDIVFLVSFLITSIVSGRVVYKLRLQTEKAEKEQQRSTVLRSVAHDLRSPLTALSGEGELLSENYDKLSDDQRRSLIEDMTQEITWLTNLVENILGMTRISENGLTINKQDEVVDDVIEQAVRHIRRLLGKRKLEVKLPQTVITAEMDGRLIVQVLVNLLENAVKHSPDGSVITVGCLAEDDDVKFYVADCGDGIDPSVRNRLFEQYVTLDRGITDSSHGIGLGLSICKAIIDAHGGNIYASDNHPCGAVFTFTIPGKQAEI
jgi:K+-sensing histidine kinase KdpD